MNMNDEELQRQIEQNAPVTGAEGRIYKSIFETLRREPDFNLSHSFADRVISRIESAKESKTELIWMGVGIFSFMIAALVAALMSNYELNFGVMKFISGYPGLVAFGITLILALQWIDKKFVRKSSVI